MADFDPYLEWLGIPTQGRAPHHYRLLGLDLFESDPNIIAGAADRQIAHVRTFQNGPQGNIAQDVLNRLANARLTLLKPESKSAYDQKLKQRIHEMRAARAQAQGGNPQSRPAVTTAQRLPGSPAVEISGAPITTAPPQKKGNPLVKMIFMITTWLSSAVAAVVVGYFIINSSWFPGNQPDPDVIDDNDDGGPFRYFG